MSEYEYWFRYREYRGEKSYKKNVSNKKIWMVIGKKVVIRMVFVILVMMYVNETLRAI